MRSIKPQNLLLTGPLPLEEIYDPEKTPEAEEQRRQANFSTEKFVLKIADFGFARHLQNTSLAETLCGSPLYMAPEILQHHRYDAKADLWSVGTVLFEMITGEPPFHGENHIDLLRNIQRKAVRLPKDVKVSKECVNLLRGLLNRNPISRAGFKEFFEACDAFVSLGCNGATVIDNGTCRRRIGGATDLGTIPENGSESLMTVATHSSGQHQQHPVSKSSQTAPIPIESSTALVRTPDAMKGRMLTPLVASPPTSYGVPSMTELPPIIAPKPHPVDLQGSADESSFVMVEHGSLPPKSPMEETPATTAVVSHHYSDRHQLQHSPSDSPGFLMNIAPVLRRGEYITLRQPKGMLSTSPGTGGALMGMFTGRPLITNAAGDGLEADSKIKSAAKMLAAAEDVGRRAISVAHLGDKLAYLAIRLAMVMESSGNSVFSVTPMEGIEEEEGHDSGEVTDDSSSTEIMASNRPRRSSSVSMGDEHKTGEEDIEDMPFALQTETNPLVSAGLPTRPSVPMNRDDNITNRRTSAKPTPALIRANFSEALTCYVKALKMLKGAVGATETSMKDLESLSAKRLTMDHQSQISQVRKRCDVTLSWLGNQFQGVLERADASNVELGKLHFPATSTENPRIPSVEELLYNHALGFGREGAVKHLLGHYEAARACYRAAGLLAETLLMEQKVQDEDRKTLEDFVDGFSQQIAELDSLLVQQSRMSASSAANSIVSSRRGLQSMNSSPPLAHAPFALHSAPL